MRKIIFSALIATSALLASCSKKSAVTTDYFSRYNAIFLAKCTLGTAD